MRLIALVFAVAVNASAFGQQPRKVWEVSVPKASELEVSGNDVLLILGDSAVAVYDASSGKKLGSLDNVFSATLSAGRLLAVRGDYYKPGVLEVYALRPFKVEARMPNTRRLGLGQIVGKNLFYATENSVIRARYPGFETLDLRTLPSLDFRYRIRVSDGTVYFNAGGHETYGLKASDLSKGWRSYCDAWPQHVDEHGFVGTATVMWGLKIVDRSGKIIPVERIGNGGYSFTRAMPVVTKDYVVAAGNVSISGYGASQGYESKVLSEYLLAFNRNDGSLAWRVPMLARLAFYSSGLAPVLLNKNRILVYGANKKSGEHVWTLQVRELKTGRLLWKSRPVPEESLSALAGNGTVAVELDDQKLRAWRLPD